MAQGCRSRPMRQAACSLAWGGRGVCLGGNQLRSPPLRPQIWGTPLGRRLRSRHGAGGRPRLCSGQGGTAAKSQATRPLCLSPVWRRRSRGCRSLTPGSWRGLAQATGHRLGTALPPPYPPFSAKCVDAAGRVEPPAQPLDGGGRGAEGTGRRSARREGTRGRRSRSREGARPGAPRTARRPSVWVACRGSR